MDVLFKSLSSSVPTYSTLTVASPNLKVAFVLGIDKLIFFSPNAVSYTHLDVYKRQM